MEWFYLALLSPAIWALVNLIDDNLIRDIYKNPYFATITSGLFASLPLLSLFFIKITVPSIDIIFLAILSGFLNIITYWLYFKSLLVESPSVTIALWSLTAILVPLLAFVFLGEILGVNQYIGFVIVLLSSIGISLSGVKKFRMSKAFYLMTASSVILAVTYILQKHVYNTVDFWSGFVFVPIGMVLCALFFAIFFRKGRRFFTEFVPQFKKYSWIFVISEVLNVAAVLVFSLAVSKGPVTLVEVIGGVQPMFVLLFAILFYPFFPKYFREAAHGSKIKKAIFFLLILAGLYLINL